MQLRRNLIHFRSIFQAQSFQLCIVGNQITGTSKSSQCQAVRDIGTLHTQEFMMRDIEPNVPSHLSWYSHGKWDSDATCVTMDFMRNDVEYKNSYEWSTAKFTFTFRTRKTKPGLVTGGEEILLGHGIQMLAKKLSQEDACFGAALAELISVPSGPLVRTLCPKAGACSGNSAPGACARYI